MKKLIRKKPYLEPDCEVVDVEMEREVLAGSVPAQAEDMEEEDGSWG